MLNSPNPPGQTLGLDVLNQANANNLADVLRYIAGPNMAIGDLLNALIVTANAVGTTQAVQTLTVGGVPAAGQALTVTIENVQVTYMQSAADTNDSSATGLVTAINSNSAATGLVTAALVSGSTLKLTANSTNYPGATANAITLATSATGTATLTASNSSFAGSGSAPVTPGTGSIPLIVDGTVSN